MINILEESDEIYIIYISINLCGLLWKSYSNLGGEREIQQERGRERNRSKELNLRDKKWER